MSSNPSPKAIQLLRENFEKIDWWWLSSNTSPEAIQLLRENFTNINWHSLSSNPSPEAIQLLCANPKKINWHNFCNGNKHIYRVLCPYNYSMIEQVVAGPFRDE